MAELPLGGFELDGRIIADDQIVTVTSFTPGQAAWQTQDAMPAAGNRRAFGNDYLQGPEWDLEFLANTGDPAEQIDELEGLSGHWLATKRDRGTESVLRFNIGGQTRRIYGRPRRFLFNPTDVWQEGYAFAAGTFQASDPLQYEDVERIQVVTLLAGTSGGLLAPLSGTLTTVSGGSQSRVIRGVGGKAPAPFIAEIKGPVTNPYVRIDNEWEIGVNGTLAFDQTLIIDTRLKTARLSNGASWGGKITRRSRRLDEARLEPGDSTVLFGGTDQTGTAQLTLRWRPTYLSF